jgi:hypothetical protein
MTAIKDFENASRRTLSALRIQLQQTLERAGVEFLGDAIRVRPQLNLDLLGDPASDEATTEQSEEARVTPD